MNKLIVVVFISLLIFSCIFILNNYKEESMDKENKVYQGPVRPTDDLDYFRLTGITRTLEVKE